LRYIILIAVISLLIYGSYDTNIKAITPWLLGINFTLALFSINFTFFGYQLSKYKTIYHKVTKRQWFNISIILILPFIPLISYLIVPEYFGKIALWMLPVLIFSAIDNALLTTKYLNPQLYLESKTTNRSISKYLLLLSKEVRKETATHQQHLDNRKKIQMPIESYSFEPTTFGLEVDDIWDSVTLVIKLSIENNDYPVFRKTIFAMLELIIASYSFECDEDYRVADGIQHIARKRMRSLIKDLINDGGDSIFLASFSNEICNHLNNEKKFIEQPCSDLTRMVVSEIKWTGQKMLEYKTAFEPMKILNTIYGFIEKSIQKLETEEYNNNNSSLDKYNISIYVHEIKSLGISALNCGNAHFGYRCMDYLSYLGCNAAKLKSKQTVVAVIESIVHLGRVARNLKIGCFWDRCLIPAESHAEEFMGHILTWLVQDIDSSGNFYMKGYAEQAYSRLRGVKCLIKPKSNSHPYFWIEEMKAEGKKRPHIEYESGMYGYDGQADYSDFSNLKQYVLDGRGSHSTAMVFNSEPIPLNMTEVDDTET